MNEIKQTSDGDGCICWIVGVGIFGYLMFYAGAFILAVGFNPPLALKAYTESSNKARLRIYNTGDKNITCEVISSEERDIVKINANDHIDWLCNKNEILRIDCKGSIKYLHVKTREGKYWYDYSPFPSHDFEKKK